jgi:6-pyruvoyltetrahydropterin/6-carboxytetrahydropterin synthase
MFRLQVKSHFDSAHFIRDYKGKCSRMHGHRWDIEVCLQGKGLDAGNMLIDFSIVKKMVKEYIEERLDHYVLNEQLGEPNLTAEFIAKWIFDELEGSFKGAVRLIRVCVWENPDCCVKYSPDMKSINEDK